MMHRRYGRSYFKMKKLNIIIVLGLIVLSSSLAIAGVLSISNKQADLTREADAFYNTKSITPDYKDYETADGVWFYRCLISNTEFNLPCSQYFNATDLSEFEKENQLDDWMNERLEGIAQVQIGRDNRLEDEKKREGNITFGEKQ